jgi:hypothetical protein
VNNLACHLPIDAFLIKPHLSVLWVCLEGLAEVVLGLLQTEHARKQPAVPGRVGGHRGGELGDDETLVSPPRHSCHPQRSTWL